MRIASRQSSDGRDLAEIERQLAVLPDSVELQFARACCLEDLGWDEAASHAYAAVLQREPRHLGARTNLGEMVRERGDLVAARTLHARTAEYHPFEAIAHVNLAVTLAELGDADALRHFRAALALDAEYFPAHHGLALWYERCGDAAAAQQHFTRAFARGATWSLPYAGEAPPLRVLLLVSGRGGDLVAHPFLDARTMHTTLLVPDGLRAGVPLPPHDVIFNSIGDADRCRPSLERARVLFAGHPTINPPERVLASGRDALAERVRGIAGVVAPRTVRYARADLSAARLAADGWTFPLLVRAPGFHGGRAFERVDDPGALAGVLAALPGADVFAIAFAETRDATGAYCKYRVIVVDGRLYPAHRAVAHAWKVHYFSSAMESEPAYREAERAFLDDMPGVLGAPALAALAGVARELGLDYAGIDFGIDRTGNVVVFEANATMSVAPPPPGDRWAYRRAAYDAIRAAASAMIERRAAR